MWESRTAGLLRSCTGFAEQTWCDPPKTTLTLRDYIKKWKRFACQH
ncbi:hypothetical protein [Thermolongibacillus altinsuensis]|nr:hypothetical protein [Thermolongibacillus altinsuensis]